MVPKAEAIRISEQLRSAVSSSDLDQWDFDEIYELALVVGKARILEATPSLERLLDAQEPMTLCLVLDTLCTQWERRSDYIERIMTFAVGSVWDEELDVQEKSIEILGDYIRDRIKEEKGKASQSVKRVVELLWQQFASDEEDWMIRRAAYRALLTGAGRPVPKKDPGRALFGSMPQFENEDDIPADLDSGAIREIRTLLG
jgi:hypothetical protein